MEIRIEIYPECLRTQPNIVCMQTHSKQRYITVSISSTPHMSIQSTESNSTKCSVYYAIYFIRIRADWREEEGKQHWGMVTRVECIGFAAQTTVNLGLIGCRGCVSTTISGLCVW